MLCVCMCESACVWCTRHVNLCVCVYMMCTHIRSMDVSCVHRIYKHAVCVQMCAHVWVV